MSAVVGVPRATPIAVHVPKSAGTVTFVGQAIVGSCVSTTVTVCEHVAVFDDPSTIVHTTVVDPSGYVAGALFVTEATVQLSAVTGVPKATPEAVHKPKSAETVTFTGHTIVGSSLSVTVTVCVHVAAFPEPSTAVHVTVVTPSGNTAGALFVTEPIEQLSLVVADPSTTVEEVQRPASVVDVTATGQAIVGS